MKCRHLSSFALVVCLSFFFGSFIITNDSFAVSDLTVTYHAGDSIPAGTAYFPSANYSDYNFIIFDFDNPSPDFVYSSTFNIRASCNINYFGSVRSLNVTNEYIDTFFSLNSLKTCYSFMSNPNNSTILLSDLTITLTDKLPSFSSSASLSITQNGTYDVTNYSQAIVNVPAEVVPGDYHDDLVNIQNAIITCGAILLVLYFFYCIYRLIIKNSGVH